MRPSSIAVLLVAAAAWACSGSQTATRAIVMQPASSAGEAPAAPPRPLVETSAAPGAGQPAPPVVVASTAPTAPGVAPTDADDLQVVDCALPAQVRKLGRRMTIVVPRRPLKTTAIECEIRGGEYVLLDAGSLEQALGIWKPLAEQGDAKAQNYVGEIYERGLGVPPDYAEAARWYRRAAERGYAPAQINLGQLHELGRGVPTSLSEALAWYRAATGLEPQVPFVASSDAPEEKERLQRELSQSRQELSQSRRQVSRLEADVERVSGELAAARAARDTSGATLTSERDAVERERLALERDRAKLAEETRRLEDARAALARTQTDAAAITSSRQAELTALSQRVGEMEAQLAARARELDGRSAALAQAERRAEERGRQVAALEEEIARLKQERERERAQVAASQQAAKPAKAVELAGPTIQMIDPRLPPTQSRGDDAVQTAPGVSKRPVIGRVEAPAGLFSLLVNDLEVKPDGSGIFRSDVALGGPEVWVSVVAVDRAGKRAERRFAMRPGAAAPTVAAKVPDLDFGRYHALLIGNSEYRHLPDLETSLNDVRAVGAVLRDSYGFELTILENADRYALLSALNTLRAKLNEKDNLLIYYAGHGELDKVNMRGYWLPVDAERDSTANWISNIQLTDQLNAMNAQHVLVVADSCYSGALTRSSLARLESGMTREAKVAWQRKMVENRARVALTSGALKPVLDGGGGAHSIFAKAFIEVLKSNREVLEGARLAQEIAALVTYAAESANFDQMPQYAPIKFAGHEAGDFLFVPAIATPATVGSVEAPGALGGLQLLGAAGVR